MLRAAWCQVVEKWYRAHPICTLSDTDCVTTAIIAYYTGGNSWKFDSIKFLWIGGLRLQWCKKSLQLKIVNIYIQPCTWFLQVDTDEIPEKCPNLFPTLLPNFQLNINKKSLLWPHKMTCHALKYMCSPCNTKSLVRLLGIIAIIPLLPFRCGIFMYFQSFPLVLSAELIKCFWRVKIKADQWQDIRMFLIG